MIACYFQSKPLGFVRRHCEENVLYLTNNDLFHCSSSFGTKIYTIIVFIIAINRSDYHQQQRKYLKMTQEFIY